MLACPGRGWWMADMVQGTSIPLRLYTYWLPKLQHQHKKQYTVIQQNWMQYFRYGLCRHTPYYLLWIVFSAILCIANVGNVFKKIPYNISNLVFSLGAGSSLNMLGKDKNQEDHVESEKDLPRNLVCHIIYCIKQQVWDTYWDPYSRFTMRVNVT